MLSASPRVILTALWCLTGLVLLLAQASIRLAPRFFEVVHELDTTHWVIFFLWVAFMAYTEGYRGFQLRFGPRFAARAVHLGRHPRPTLFVVLGPLYAMALFHTTRRRLVGSWGLVAMIISFVMLLRYCPQPWRGIIDGGVVVGLVYGMAVTTWFTLRALASKLEVDPELPPAALEAPASRR